MFELRELQKEIIPKGITTLKKHFMVWLTGQERAGKTLPALGILNDGGFTNALCITTIKAGIDIKAAKEAMGGPCNLDIINYESAHKLLKLKDKYQVIWLDESHKLGQAPKPAKTVATVRMICQNKFIIYSTATPSGEGFYKLYHQLFVSSASPFAAWPNYYKWAKDFCRPKKVWRNGALHDDWTDAIFEKVWPMVSHLFITWTREDAGFKVDAEDKILTVRMRPETVAIFHELNRHKIYTHPNGRVATITGGAQLISKLNQIGSGTMKFDPILDGDNDGYIFDYSKAEFIQSKFVGKKIAIFFKYIAEGKLLRSFFPNHTESAHEFNSRNDLIFIGQVKSYCEGVDLSSADALVNYNLEFSATVYSQSRARHLTKDRVKPAPVYYLFPEHGIDHKIYEAVSNKKNFTWTYYSNNQTNVRKRNTGEDQKAAGVTRLQGASTN